MLARAAEGAADEGDWLIAESQTAGRGRMGREWKSPSGNLHASGLVDVRARDPIAPTLALVAGIAVWDAFGGVPLALKWPNDIVVIGAFEGPAKLAGILLERVGHHVVIGVGANLAHRPDIADQRVTDLQALGRPMAVDAAIEALAQSLGRWLDVWRGEGLEAIRTAWLDRAHPLGTPLAVTSPDGERIEGRFAGLTADCALQLGFPGGELRTIHAGDVFFI